MENLGIYPRSYLFVPAHKEIFFKNLFDYQYDCLIFDFEDAVAPNHKVEARRTLSSFLRSSNIVNSRDILLRTNPVNSVFFKSDFEFAISHGIGSIVLPKVNSLVELNTVAELARHSNYIENIKLYPLIETATAIENAYNIASFSFCQSLIFGHEDYLDSINGSDICDQRNLYYARSRVVNSAKAFNKGAIDSPYLKLEDQIGCLEYARQSSSFGFDGMLVLHPLQLTVVNSGYTPSSEQFEKANQILDSCNNSLSGTNTISYKDGVFIAPPIRKQAKKIIAKYLFFNKFAED